MTALSFAMGEALAAAGFHKRAIPCGAAYDSPLTLPDGTVVCVYMALSAEAVTVFCDVSQDIANAGLSDAPVLDLFESYRIQDRYPGPGQIVRYHEGPHALVAAVWDVVGYQIAAYSHAMGRRDAAVRGPDPSAG